MSLRTFITISSLLLLSVLWLTSSTSAAVVTGSRLARSRSDIPIEEDLDQEIKEDLDRFEEIKQNIHKLKHLLKQNNDDSDEDDDVGGDINGEDDDVDIQMSTETRLERLRLEMKAVKEEEEIEVMEKDLQEIEDIIMDLGSNLTAKTTKDIRKMLTGSSVLLAKLEKQLSDLKESQHRQLTNSLASDHDEVNDDVDELPEFLQVPTLEEFNHFTLPYHFDRESEKHQYGRKTFFKTKTRTIGAEMEIKPIKKKKDSTEEKQTLKSVKVHGGVEAVDDVDNDNKDDPLIVAVISLAIVIVAGILVAVLSVYCCKRCQYQKPSGSSLPSPAYASDDFENEEDVYLEDFGEGEFFEWPKTPLRGSEHQQQQRQQDQQQHQLLRHQLRQKQVIVEYTRGYSEGYCRLTTGAELTQL